MRYELFQDASSQWRWRYIVNGRIIGVSSESYWNESDCRRSIDLMKASAPAPVYKV